MKKLFTSLMYYFLSFMIHSEIMSADLLYLDQVLKTVDGCYPQIQIAKLEIAKAETAYLSAQGKFDPSIDANTRSQPFGGYVNNYGNTQFNLPTIYNGVTLFAGYRNGRGDWPSYYQNYLTNSGGEYRVGASLPLLRDRFIDKARMSLFTTTEAICMSKNEAQAVKIKIYQEAIKSYWQWVEAGLQLKILRKLLNLAKTRQEAITKQAEQGDLPKLAITENSQLIVQRQQLLNQGKLAFEQASIHLSIYYRDAKAKPLIPQENNLPMNLFNKKRPIRTRAFDIKQHPALKKLQHYAQIIRIKRDLARNELLPNLDLNTYTSKQNGQGGDPLLIPQTALVEFSFKFPLYQREAKGKLIRAQTELAQLRAQRKLLYEQLVNEFKNLSIAIRRIHQQTNFLKKELALALIMQRGETRKFYEGDSTLFLVNQREQVATQVELNWVNTQVQLEELKDQVRFFLSTQR